MAAPLINTYRDTCPYGKLITTLRLILPEDVASAPRAFGVPNLEGNVQLAFGKNFYTIEADPRSSVFTDELREGIHGDSYQQSLRFDVRRLSVDVALLRSRLRNRRVHALFTDVEDVTYYLPNLRLRRATNERPTLGYKGNRLELRGASIGPAVTIDGGLVDPPPGSENNIILQDPTSGQKFRLIIGPCEELITVPVITNDPATEVMVDNYVLSVEEDGITSTNQPPPP